MKRKRFLWLVFFISISLSAQVKGIVVDEFNKPISYVNIWVENESKGTTSEEDGTFTINTNTDKTLIFSVLGFETQKVKASETEKVTMKPLVFQLKEVVISKPKNTKEIEVGDSKNRFYLPEPQEVPMGFARNINVDANNPDVKYVKNIILYTKSEVDGGIFRVRIFNITEKGMPGEDVVSEEIIVKAKKGRHKTVVDMTAYKLEVPKEGLIIGFESLLTEGNKYRQKVGIYKTNKTTYVDNYDPHILYYHSKSENSYAFRTGSWTKQLFKMYPEQESVLSPAINVTLTN